MDLSIPLELRQIQDSVRAFIARELAPLEDQVDLADDIDPATMHELRQRAVQLGIYGFNLPGELGGGGIGPLGEVLVGEEIGRTSMPLAEVIGRLPQSLTLCDDEQAEWLLKPALRAEKTTCIALTEPEAGSDLGAVRTRAARAAGGWLLNGSKHFISNAETSDYILVLAVTDPSAPLRDRFTVFIVDRTNPGLHFTHRFRKLGWHGYHISAFSLDDCQLGPECVLGGVGNGFGTIMASVNRTRLYIAARCVGAAQHLVQLAANYAGTRRTFGQLLGQHEAIQFMLADMDVELQAARMLVLAAAWELDTDKPDARIATSRAKLYASEMAEEVCSHAIQIHGGYGFLEDYGVERHYRDARITQIYEGTSEVQRMVIARNV